MLIELWPLDRPNFYESPTMRLEKGNATPLIAGTPNPVAAGSEGNII